MLIDTIIALGADLLLMPGFSLAQFTSMASDAAWRGALRRNRRHRRYAVANRQP
jgi:hypothetical protein